MLLELNDVSKALVALQPSQEYLLALNKVKYLVLLVQNGAGKTTLFNLITGVFPVSSGEIVLMVCLL